jgi:two-component system chemotaxis response regulator CheB
MRRTGIVVVGASAGGVEALRRLVAGLSPEFPLPICVVLHVSPRSPGLLDEILDRAGPLRAKNACAFERLRPGRIYVAPPDRHLIVEPGVVRLTRGPRENWFRPAINPLFHSAARVYGPAAIGVVLSGNLHDGTAGLGAIKELGGIAIIQDPADALFPSMPRNALESVNVDYCVRRSDMASLLSRLAARQAEAADVPGREPSTYGPTMHRDRACLPEAWRP